MPPHNYVVRFWYFVVWSIVKEVLVCITASEHTRECGFLWFPCWPWRIFSFQKLVKTGENNWSLPELVHAVVLLAHYHALASFVFGSGINPEREPGISNGFRLISVNSFCVCDLANDNNIDNASLAGNNFGVRSQLSLRTFLLILSREFAVTR